MIGHDSDSKQKQSSNSEPVVRHVSVMVLLLCWLSEFEATSLASSSWTTGYAVNFFLSLLSVLSSSVHSVLFLTWCYNIKVSLSQGR